MINKKYSHKDFTGQDLSDQPKEDFVGEIVGSCFAQENLREHGAPKMKKTVPPGLDETTIFRDCNIDNVDVGGAVVEGGQHRMHRAEHDGADWVYDKATNKIKEPLSVKHYEMLGIPTDPKYIPKTKPPEGQASILKLARRHHADRER
jgi:hypothetical protein